MIVKQEKQPVAAGTESQKKIKNKKEAASTSRIQLKKEPLEVK